MDICCSTARYSFFGDTTSSNKIIITHDTFLWDLFFPVILEPNFYIEYII